MAKQAALDDKIKEQRAKLAKLQRQKQEEEESSYFTAGRIVMRMASEDPKVRAELLAQLNLGKVKISEREARKFRAVLDGIKNGD